MKATTIIAVLLGVLALVACEVPTTEEELMRCTDAPPALVQQLNAGLSVVTQGRAQTDSAKVIENNNLDGIPWKFIAADVQGPGLEEIEAWVWASASLDLDKGGALIVAADSNAAKLSIWNFPNAMRMPPDGDRLYFTSDKRYKDELRIVRACVESG